MLTNSVKKVTPKNNTLFIFRYYMNILKFSGWDSGLNLTNSSWKLQSQQSYKSTTLQFKKLKENKTEQFDQLLKKIKQAVLKLRLRIHLVNGQTLRSPLSSNIGFQNNIVQISQYHFK